VPALLQVGLGTWGLDWATKVLPEVPEMEFVACVDARQEALKSACDAGVIAARQCYSSVADAIRDQKADAVLVTTDGSHGDIVRAALRAEKHVLCEKPFVGSVAEARELIDEAAALNCTLMVSQNYRFFPAVRAPQSIVKSKELGQLVHVDVDFRRFNPEGRQLRWAHPLLLDIGIHHFDLMRAVLGSESFSGGAVLRSGCCFRRGKGRVFYFSPGDQDHPVYHDANVRRVIANAVRWCAPGSTAREVPASGRVDTGWYQPDGV
jgi:predicted dehydrogenase